MFPYGIFAFVTLLAASIIQCEKLHKRMTDEEIAKFFHASPDNVPEYEVVSVRHNLHERASSNFHLEFTAFGEQINAYLEPSTGVLATTNTPVWLALTLSDGTIKYQKLRKDAVGIMDAFFLSGIKVSSIVAILDEDKNASFEGTVHGMTIRSLPKRFREAWKSSREIESPKRSGTLLETHHHVIIKSSSSMNESEKLPNLGRQSPKTRIFTEATHSKSKRSTRDTVYLSILVTTDFPQSQMNLNDFAFYDEIIYQLAFWNAVDLRFRHVENPKIRLHIAGIVIGLDRRATPYLDRYRNGHEITLGWNTFEMMTYWSHLAKPSAFSRLDYDIVISMTDNDIIEIKNRNTPHRILGLASYGTLCSYDSHMFEALAIVQDAGGFSGVITATHELGHILGIAHDGEVRPGDQPADKCDEARGFIMTTPRDPAPQNLKWSPCSLSRLSKFLRHRRIKCVDEPVHLRNRQAHPGQDPGTAIQRLLPGDIVDTDKQCQGRGYSWACASRPEMCSNMWCYHTYGPAFLYGWWCQDAGPAIDGTSCSPGHKCLDGVCQCFTEECIFNKTQSVGQ